MLYFNAMRVLDLRGIERPYSYLRQNGFTHSMAGNIINNRVLQIRVEQIEQLCLLLNCVPSDLFEWRDDGGKTIAGNHAIHSLARDDSAHISRLVKDIPVEKLGKLTQMIEELRDEKI